MVYMLRRPPFAIALGNVIGRRRRDRKLSQEKLAFAADLHRTYISLLERGRKSPTLDTLHEIARALGTTTSKLVLEAEELQSRSR
jgi:transcriptional regulator with XRE-family HTH domain